MMAKLSQTRLQPTADEAVKKIISEAKEAADITIGAAEDKAAKEKFKNDKLVAEEKEKAAAKQISGAEMQAKKAVLAEKQAILEEVIGEALHRLTNLPDSEYTETIGTMLDSIDKNLGTEIIVSERDRKRLADVITEKGFTLSDRTADIDGGLIVRNRRHRIQLFLQFNNCYRKRRNTADCSKNTF